MTRPTIAQLDTAIAAAAARNAAYEAEYPHIVKASHTLFTAADHDKNREPSPRRYANIGAPGYELDRYYTIPALAYVPWGAGPADDPPFHGQTDDRCWIELTDAPTLYLPGYGPRDNPHGSLSPSPLDQNASAPYGRLSSFAAKQLHQAMNWGQPPHVVALLPPDGGPPYLYAVTDYARFTVIRATSWDYNQNRMVDRRPPDGSRWTDPYNHPTDQAIARFRSAAERYLSTLERSPHTPTPARFANARQEIAYWQARQAIPEDPGQWDDYLNRYVFPHLEQHCCQEAHRYHTAARPVDSPASRELTRLLQDRREWQKELTKPQATTPQQPLQPRPQPPARRRPAWPQVQTRPEGSATVDQSAAFHRQLSQPQRTARELLRQLDQELLPAIQRRQRRLEQELFMGQLWAPEMPLSLTRRARDAGQSDLHLENRFQDYWRQLRPFIYDQAVKETRPESYAQWPPPPPLTQAPDPEQGIPDCWLNGGLVAHSEKGGTKLTLRDYHTGRQHGVIAAGGNEGPFLPWIYTPDPDLAFHYSSSVDCTSRQEAWDTAVNEAAALQHIIAQHRRLADLRRNCQLHETRERLGLISEEVSPAESCGPREDTHMPLQTMEKRFLRRARDQMILWELTYCRGHRAGMPGYPANHPEDRQWRLRRPGADHSVLVHQDLYHVLEQAMLTSAVAKEI